MKRLIKVAIWLVILGLIGGGAYWYFERATKKPITYRTAAVKRGDLLASIGATGTAEPEELVDVGAQVNGQIKEFGKDTSGKPIDYGSTVEENMVLAQIDESLYAADVASATAQAQLAEGQLLFANAQVETSTAAVQAAEAGVQASEAAGQAAEAGVTKAEADLKQMDAKLVQAKNDWDRAQKLGTGEALSQTVYDGYKAAYETAKANVGVDEAAILQAKAAVLQAKATVLQTKSAVAQAQGTLAQSKSSVAQAKAQVAQAKATMDKASRNLSYCTIKSPVKGSIIDRRVNIGQTVVSSLSASSMFLIARDLKRMEVWVSVNEADIGNIHPGQAVTFTVDAFPGQIFKGTVGRIRLNAIMTQNVVTYTVEVTTDNADGKLLPYLTANAQFEVSRRTGVLLVPNAALRWFPTQIEQVAPEYREMAQAGTRRGSKSAAPSTVQGGSRGEAKSAAPSTAHGGSRGERKSAAPSTVHGGETKGWTPPTTAQGVEGTPRVVLLWVRQVDGLRPIKVRIGLSDGFNTEVSGKDLEEGMEVIMGEERQSAATAGTTNPFTPQMFGQKGK